MTQTPEGEAISSEPKSSWQLFPLLWLAGLAGICLLLKNLDIDPGYPNTAIIIALYLAPLGIALWAWLRSSLKFPLRHLLTIIPLLFAYSISPFGPVKLILSGDLDLLGWRWRWAATPDELLVLPETSQAVDALQTTPNDYPRFLGNGYWAEVKGIQLETDWQANPPKELWRKKIGAGWSAFAIVGNYAFTQEQRGEQELVSCYEVLTGDIAWTHTDPVRWDPGGTGALGYAGPRATPTIDGGKVFTHGATGILNCLDAKTGERLWSHDTLQKHDAINVNWGKSGSPLVVDDIVIVSVGGAENQSIVAYNIDSGDVVWNAGTYQSSYASPIVATLAGVRQVISVDEGFVTSRTVENGEFLWEHEWPSSSGTEAATSQPIPLPGDQLFLSKGYGHGAALLQISQTPKSGWQLTPEWKKARQYGQKPVMKTKMANVVMHNGYVYGLDSEYLECIELETGKRKWKKRRNPKFGNGQIMLIGDTILFLSEPGELILVEPNPKKYTELASLQVFHGEPQITWNNPAFSSPYLLVRDAEEAVCYELPLKAEPLEEQNETDNSP